MPNDFESMFREMLNVIVKEVVAEIAVDRSRETPPVHSESIRQALLLNSRDAAEMLAISEAHLNRLTRSGTVPHIRVGKCLRYSVEALRDWIRHSESTESPPSRTVTTKQPVIPKPIERVTSASKSITQPRKQSKSTDARKAQEQTNIPVIRKTRPAKQKSKQDPENDNRRNPFVELLAEVGIDRSSLPSLTNGELMRISETDLITCHGWMYLDRPLPEEARDKLKKHFMAIVSKANEG